MTSSRWVSILGTVGVLLSLIGNSGTFNRNTSNILLGVGAIAGSSAAVLTKGVDKKGV